MWNSENIIIYVLTIFLANSELYYSELLGCDADCEFVCRFAFMQYCEEF